jgi:hypothetical protein
MREMAPVHLFCAWLALKEPAQAALLCLVLDPALSSVGQPPRGWLPSGVFICILP